MRHLLTGIALAAALAVGIPAAMAQLTTEELNRQELQRLQTPQTMPAPAAGRAASGQVGPSPGGGQNIRPGAQGAVSMKPGTTEEGPRVSGGGNIPMPTGPVPVTAPPPIAAPVR